MRVFTPDDGYHYFFGYYDLQPFDSTERFHLMHRVPFMDRLPEAGGNSFDLLPLAMLLSAIPMILTIKSKRRTIE